MFNKFFIFILSLSMKLHDVCSDFFVKTHLQYKVDHQFWPTITCQHNGNTNETFRARLYEKRRICDMQNSAMCKMSQHGNQFNFTLKNASRENHSVFTCEVYRSSPVPVIIREGEEVKLNLALDPHLQESCNACLPKGLFSLPPYVTLALIVITVLLCLYSLTVTTLYIRLRIKMSQDLYETLTYVPMQRKVRRHDPDKNTEYMDMREVHQQPGPIRDMNFNSSHHANHHANQSVPTVFST